VSAQVGEMSHETIFGASSMSTASSTAMDTTSKPSQRAATRAARFGSCSSASTPLGREDSQSEMHQHEQAYDVQGVEARKDREHGSVAPDGKASSANPATPTRVASASHKARLPDHGSHDCQRQGTAPGPPNTVL